MGETLRARGAADLECPETVVQAYRAHGGVFVARGCEKWIEYSCFRSAGAPVCIRQSDANADPGELTRH